VFAVQGIDSETKMNGIPADTRLEAARKEFEVLRKLGPQVRARMTFEMSDNPRRTVEAGVRHRHPDFDRKKVQLEVLRLIIGDKLAPVIASEAKQSQWRR
jgi:hypothetical protein